MGKLRDWFGPSRAEVWHDLSRRIGGSYTKATWRATDRVTVEHGPWTVTLDTYTMSAGHSHVPFTRFRAPFVESEGFRLKIYRSTVFSAIGKWFGMQDVAVGSLQFDADFVVKTNDERKARAFCRSDDLRRRLSAQKSVTLSIEDHEGWFGPKFPADTDELRLVVAGHLKDIERLRALFELFGTALDQLVAIGAAEDTAPSMKL